MTFTAGKEAPGEPGGYDEWAQSLRDYLARSVVHTPGARSAFRRGLRRSPLECAHMHRFIPARFVPDWGVGGARERAVYTAAALAGAWPQLCDDRSGRSVASALGALGRADGEHGSWADRRLEQLCRSDGTQIGDRLASVIGVLRSRGVTFDLARLAVDLDRWDRDQARVVRRWVRDFDRSASGDADATNTVDALTTSTGE